MSNFFTITNNGDSEITVTSPSRLGALLRPSTSLKATMKGDYTVNLDAEDQSFQVTNDGSNDITVTRPDGLQNKISHSKSKTYNQRGNHTIHYTS